MEKISKTFRLDSFLLEKLKELREKSRSDITLSKQINKMIKEKIALEDQESFTESPICITNESLISLVTYCSTLLSITSESQEARIRLGHGGYGIDFEIYDYNPSKNQKGYCYSFSILPNWMVNDLLKHCTNSGTSIKVDSEIVESLNIWIKNRIPDFVTQPQKRNPVFESYDFKTIYKMELDILL